MIEYKQKYTAACKSFRVSAVMLRKYSPLSPTQYSTHQSQCCLLPPCRKITFNRATICKCDVNVNVNVVVEKVKVLKKKKTMKRGCLENHCHLFQLFLGIAELVVTNLVSSPLSEPLESTSWESNSTLRISRNQCTVSKLGNLGLEWSTLKKIFLNRFSMKFTKNFMMICKHQNN